MLNKCEFHTELKETTVDHKKTQTNKTMGFEGLQLHRAAWYSAWWAKAGWAFKMSPLSESFLVEVQETILEGSALVFFSFLLSILNGAFVSRDKYFLHSSASLDSLRSHLIFYLPETVRYYFIRLSHYLLWDFTEFLFIIQIVQHLYFQTRKSF